MSINLAATSIRKTSLAQKVYAKAAERQAQVAAEKALVKELEALDAVANTNDPPVIVMPVRAAMAKKIIAAVCREFKVTEDELRSPLKTKRVVNPRHVAAYLLVTHTSLSTPQIGSLLNRDHTTVLHSHKKISLVEDRPAWLSLKLHVIERRVFGDTPEHCYFGA